MVGNPWSTATAMIATHVCLPFHVNSNIETTAVRTTSTPTTAHNTEIAHPSHSR